MDKVDIIKYINSTLDEEMAIVIDNTVVLHGDYYHDKIEETIEGFVMGLKYCRFDVAVKTEIINPSHNMFDIIGFYDNTDDYVEEKDEDEIVEYNDKIPEIEIKKPECENVIVELIKDIEPNKYNFHILHYEIGSKQIYTQNIIDALKYALNYEADLYDGDKLIFSPLGLDFEYNNELIKRYGVEFVSEDDGYSKIRKIT